LNSPNFFEPGAGEEDAFATDGTFERDDIVGYLP